MIQLTNISKSFTTQELFTNLNLKLNSGEAENLLFLKSSQVKTMRMKGKSSFLKTTVSVHSNNI